MPPRAEPSTSIVSVPQVIPTPTRPTASRNSAEVVARRALEGHAPAGDGRRHDERAGLDPVGNDPVLGAAQALAALDLDRVRRGPLDLGAHRAQEGDEVVDLGLLGGRSDDGVALGERRGQHRVLRAHDRHEREGDLRPAQASRRRGEVVAVAVVDRGPQRPHRLDVQVHGPSPDPVAAGVADDDPPEARQQRAEQDEAGPHLRRRLERHEQPLDVARGDLVGVRLRPVDDHAEVAQRVGEDADVLDVGHVRQATAFARQRGGGHELQGGILRAADRHGPVERPAALDPEEFPGHGIRAVFPVERSSVSHGSCLRSRRAAAQAKAAPREPHRRVLTHAHRGPRRRSASHRPEVA